MINQVSPSAHLLYSVYIMCGRQSVQVMISHTALLPGDVFEAAAPAVLPLECVGHHDDMPVADGPLQGQCATLTFIFSWQRVNASHAYGRLKGVISTFAL